MPATNYTQPTRTAENRNMTASTVMGIPRRRLTRGAFTILAAVLLLALPASVSSQQAPRVLVIAAKETPLTVTEHTDVTDGSCKTYYTVRLNTEPTSAVTVKVASADEKVAKVDLPSLTFNPTDDVKPWHATQMVTITCVDDKVDNLDDERDVAITNSPEGGGFNTPEEVKVTVYDDDNASLQVSNAEDVVVGEGAVAATVAEEGPASIYKVKLTSEPTGNVIVNVASSDSSAATASPAKLTFTAKDWDVNKTITVVGVDDDKGVERSVTITHTPNGGGYGVDEIRRVKVTVNNVVSTTVPGDSKGLSFTRSSFDVVEGDKETYTVKLKAEPESTVTLDLLRSSAMYIRISPPSLTFNTDNWDNPQLVTVIGNDDDRDNSDGNRTTMITHRPIGGGYEGVTGTGVTVNLKDDNHVIGLTLSTPTMHLRDEGQSIPYTVKLNSKPKCDTSPPCTVTVMVAAMGEGASVPATSPVLMFDESNWDITQSVSVIADDDDVDNVMDERRVIITNTPAGSDYTAAESESVTVTIEDTDHEGLIISTTALIVPEGEKERTYTVRLASEAAVNVDLEVEANSGVKVTPNTVVFGTDDWDEEKRVVVTSPPDDKVVNIGSRLVTITHTPSNDYATEKKLDVTVTNVNKQSDISFVPTSLSSVSEDVEDSKRPTYTVKLKAAPMSGTVTLTVSVSGEAATVSTDGNAFSSMETLSFSSTNTSGTVTIDPDSNEVDNGDSRSVIVTHKMDGITGLEMRLTVLDNDNAEVIVEPVDSETAAETYGVVNYNVKLGSVPPGGATVRIVSHDPSIATVTTPDIGELIFTEAGVAQPVVISSVLNDVDDGRSRAVRITFTPKGDGGYGPTEARTRRVTIVDDDTAKLVLGDTAIEINEIGSNSYSVSLATKPTGTVRVSVESDNLRAATVEPSMLTFRPAADAADRWDTKQTVTVTGVSDSERGNRTVRIRNRATGGGYSTSESVTVTVTHDGAPRLLLTDQEIEVNEGRRATFTVELNSQLEGADTVTVDVASKSSAITVSPPRLTFTSSNTRQPVTVTGTNDTIIGDRTATVTLSSAGPGYDGISEEVQVTVIDDDAGVTVTPSSVTVVEAGGTATYTMKLNGQPTGTVTVTVTSSNTRDATATPGSLTFTTSNWNAPQTVTVTGVNDDVDNGDSRSATITNTPSGAGYSSNSVTVTVTDDEAEPTLSISGGEATEGNTGTTPLRFTVAKSGDTDQVVTVAYARIGGTATPGTDFTNVSGTLTFAASETSKTITVAVMGDEESESDETVVIRLTGPSKATIPEGKGTATGTIIDDDASRLSIKATTATVDEGDPLIFTVTLEPPVDEQVMVEAVTRGTATAGTDYTGVPEMLTFAAGEAAKTITVVVADDADYELNETVEVELRNPKPTGSVVIGTGKAMVTIEDNDDPPALSISGTSIAEGNAGTTSKLTFKVTKSGGTSMEATVAYADAGTGTATADTDYTAVAAGTLTFAPDETSKTITVVVKGDDESEGDETIVIRLASPSKATIAEGKGTAAGTIIDDDILPRVASDWLARFGRTATSATLDAIARRLNDGVVAAASSLTVAGHRASFAPEPIAQAAAGTAEPWEESRYRVLTIEELATGSSAEVSFVEGLNVWGASGYNQFEMTPQGSYTMDGSLVSAILGVDHQGDTLVAGLALAYHGGAGDFSGIGKTEGSLGTNLYSVHPYARLTFGEAIHVGASFGIGTGDLSIMDKDGAALVETGVGMPVLAAVDARMELSLAEAWILALQADGHLVQMVADEQLPRFTRVETNTHRLRLGVENSYVFRITDGVRLAPVLETGLRYDGGDAGETGLGFDVGGGLRLDATVVGLMVDARGHASLSNWGEGQEQAPMLRDWGLGGVIRWRPAGGGMGPEMSLSPAYGGTLGAEAPSLNAEIGYRMAAFGGVFTPYSAAEFGNGQQSYRAGAHFEIGQGIALSAEGTHRQSAIGDGDQFLTLEMRLRQ